MLDSPIRRGLAVAAVLASIAVTGLAAATAAPAADRRGTATACKRFGDRPAYKLRKRPARRAIVCLLNRERRQNGLPRLRRDRQLQRAAQRHNDRMVRKGCFAHECAGEGSLEQRLENASYLTSDLLRWSYGENIAWGERRRAKPRAIVRAWMNSPPHRANILNRTFEEVGVGVTDGTPERKNAAGATFTTDFGLAESGRGNLATPEGPGLLGL